MTLPAVFSQHRADEAVKRASGSSFYSAMRILPAKQRRAMFEIYAFCRAVDDIADAPGERTQRLAQLAQWRKDIHALYAGEPPPRMQGLSGPVRAFGLEREDFLAIIDGMEMDILTGMRAPDLAMLDLYCDRVASAVGRLCVRVFGMPVEDGRLLAHHLGRALQLTNILRDLDEDAAIGRLYLPREALHEAGIAATEPADVLADARIGTACMTIAARAQAHFRHADAIMARSPRRVVRAPKIMAEAYKVYLRALIARGFTPPRTPIRLGRARLLWIILRAAMV